MSQTSDRLSGVPLPENPLSVLEHAEALVRTGYQDEATWFAAAGALERIQSRRLYRLREPNRTFADYVAATFGMTRDWAYRLIRCYAMGVELQDAGWPLPAAAATLRPMEGKEFEGMRVQIWEAALQRVNGDTSAVSAETVKAAIRSLKGKKAGGAASSFRCPTQGADEIVRLMRLKLDSETLEHVRRLLYEPRTDAGLGE